MIVFDKSGQTKSIEQMNDQSNQ